MQPLVYLQTWPLCSSFLFSALKFLMVLTSSGELSPPLRETTFSLPDPSPPNACTVAWKLTPRGLLGGVIKAHLVCFPFLRNHCWLFCLLCNVQKPWFHKFCLSF